MRCKLPIYEYECSACGIRFDRRQKFDEEPTAICPECASKARRVIHSVPVLFKGSGFYCTDHGRGTRYNAGQKKEEAEIKEETKAETKAETKSEVKPDNKSETKKETTAGKSS